MPKFEVNLSGRVYLHTTVEVEADSFDDAEEKALEQAYNCAVVWDMYEDVPDYESIQVGDIEKITDDGE
jgi:hypothetical protein